jgi:hypothetical protein
MIMATKRKEFTDRQKAEIFVLDRATCCMSGKSLWLLDYGAAPSFRDWVDHINPSAKGGAAEIENGACMSWYHNHFKRDNQNMENHLLFFRGHPTQNFFLLNERIPEATAANLRRFENLHWSDWFFNRAVSHVLIAAGQGSDKRVDGNAFSRGSDYWASAAVKALAIWRKGASDIQPMAKRGLVVKPREEDRALLLSMMESTSSHQVKAVITALTPFVQESCEAVRLQGCKLTKDDVKPFLKLVRENPHIVSSVKADIRHNMQRLVYPIEWD